MKGFAMAAVAMVLSLLFNAGLFTFLPVMAYLRGTGEAGGEIKKARQVALPVMPKKKEKPKPREDAKPAARKAPEPGKAVARQRFVMDLSSGGGSGAAVAGALADGDLKQAVYEEGETDVDVRPISQAPPKLPRKAEAAGVGGLVRCLITVGEDGRVADIHFLEVPGNFGFEEAVREAVSKWRYQPASVDGVPVRQKIEQPFRF